ncbi:hypothetical protein A2U01_0071680, partial [Trifolium medium]|nr:hypothetical protein [Trifolium medium]
RFATKVEGDGQHQRLWIAADEWQL